MSLTGHHNCQQCDSTFWCFTSREDRLKDIHSEGDAFDGIGWWSEEEQVLEDEEETRKRTIELFQVDVQGTGPRKGGAQLGKNQCTCQTYQAT